MSAADEVSRTDAAPALPAVDCHLHSLSQPLYDLIAPFVGRQGGELERFSGDEIVAYLDGIGANGAYALSSAYLWAGRRPGDTESEFAAKPRELENVTAENDYVAEQAARHPGRIFPFLSINPLKPYALDELDRCAVGLHMRGLKLHFWNSAVNLRDARHAERIREVFGRAASHDLAIMLHFYNGGIEDFGSRDATILAADVLADFPDLRICFAHFLGAGNYADVVGDIVDAMMRVTSDDSSISRDRWFLDLSAIFSREPRGRFAGVTDAQLTRLGTQMREWGLDNILWGSDNREDYLGVTRDMWPLGADELRRVLANGGRALIGRAAL